MDNKTAGPPPGSLAATARLMAEIFPPGEGEDPDMWDRWKDDMKDRQIDSGLDHLIYDGMATVDPDTGKVQGSVRP